MDRLKRFALKKTTESLDKTLEAKAHFDKREEKKKAVKDIMKLQEILLDKMFHSEEKRENSEIYESIQLLNRIRSSQEISSADKRIIQDLLNKYDK